jgi:hypothetical protein
MRPFFRTAVALLSRAFLWMTFSAVLMLGALKYGPTLFAGVLPEGMRPEKSQVTGMDPQKVLDGLGQIRGALD